MDATLDHTEQIARNIISFHFRPEQPLRYSAGQFVEVTVPHHNPDQYGQKHWFTLSSSPSEDLPAITTKFPAEGPTSTFKQALHHLKQGDTVMFSSPMGDFVLPKDKTIPLVFIAGGIGITPMRSMVKWLSDTRESRDIRLLYAVNSQADVAFNDVFSAYHLKPAIILERLTAAKVLQLTPDKPQQLYFISGPEPMVESLIGGLRQAGIQDRRLIGDYFPHYPDK